MPNGIYKNVEEKIINTTAVSPANWSQYVYLKIVVSRSMQKSASDRTDDEMEHRLAAV